MNGFMIVVGIGLTLTLWIGNAMFRGSGYWNWLINGVIKFFEVLFIVPFAFWDLAKFIAGEIKKASFGILKNARSKAFSWGNICAASGAIFLTGLMFWLGFVWSLDFNIMIPWGIAEVILFLISTYAYWRDKPDE